MDTILKTPETVICKQDEELTKENDHIYFIAKGKCEVIVQDKFGDRFEQKSVRLLHPGMHFGVSYNFILLFFVRKSECCTTARGQPQ